MSDNLVENKFKNVSCQLIVEAAPNAMLLVDQEGIIQLSNSEAERLFGYFRDALVGQPVEILVPKRFGDEHSQQRAAFHAQPTARAIGAGRDLCGIRKDGTEFPAEVGLSPIKTEEGTVVLCTIVDITQRRRMENRIRLVVEAAPNAMVMVNQEGRIVLVNSQTERMFGYRRDELIDNKVELLLPEQFHRDHPQYRGHYFDNPVAHPIGAGRELYGVRKDGSEFPVEIGLSPIETDEGTFVLSAIADITERKRSEQVLAAIHDVEAKFIADAPTKDVFDGLLSSLLSFSQSAYGFIGQVLQTAAGQPYLKTHAISNIAWNEETRTFYEQNAPEGLVFLNMDTLFGRVMTSGKPLISNSPASDARASGIPPGHPPLHAFLGIPLYSQGELVGMAGVANRKGGYNETLLQKMQPLTSVCASLVKAYRTERGRKQAEKDLEQSERRFRALIEHSYDVVCLFSLDRELLYISPSVKGVLGYPADELMSADLAGMIHPDEINAYLDTFGEHLPQPGDTAHFTHRILHSSASYRVIEIAATNLLHESSIKAIVWNFRDITDRESAELQLREREAQLKHVSRLSMMGEMVASIAHEINQPLAAISNFAGACTRMLESDHDHPAERVKDWTQRISQQALRCGKIITRLRGFTNERDNDRSDADLNEIVRESLALIQADARFRAISLESELTEPSPQVFVSDIQLQQVFVNLLRNACEGTSRLGDGRGRIWVRSFVEGECTHVTVHDNGIGIATEDIDKVFDPFFTTKSSGMGLGLAISRTIVENHDGRIWVESTAQDGVTFHITLPLAQQRGLSRSFTVFVVDDDEAIADSVEAMLISDGLSVQTYRSAEAFLESYDPSRPGCLVLDIRLEGMSGLELQDELNAREIGLPIIMISGHADTGAIDTALRNGAFDVLEKPFSGFELGKKIYQIISIIENSQALANNAD